MPITSHDRYAVTRYSAALGRVELSRHARIGPAQAEAKRLNATRTPADLAARPMTVYAVYYLTPGGAR